MGWDAQGGAILVRLSGETARRPGRQDAAAPRRRGARTSVDESDERLWQRQREGQRSPEGVVVRVSAGPADLRRVLEAARTARRDARRPRRHWACRGCASTGSTTPTAIARIGELRGALAPLPVTVLDAPAAVREAVDPWGPVDPVHLALLRSVKARFDPTGACAPGLFVGGI